MVYVLLVLVVALALIAGAEYAMLRVVKAEHKAQIATLKCANVTLARKIEDYNKFNDMIGGISND